ncbi:MAG: hypothetical protein H7Y59_18400 [Anaerolineales bacterium]|nr:hypothetical protein [Anaerolineales bacterium]
MNANYRFVGSLDSAKTAHFSSKAMEKDNWWVPDDNKTWLLHTTSAAAISIKQILWGEIICVPRNQYLDSPGWLNIADFFIKSKIPLFSICIHDPDLDLTPTGFLTDCANQFKNVTGSSMFAMSGWPGFSSSERLRIYENIKSQHNFKNMLKGIRVDGKKKEYFEYQRDTLQRVLEYLTKNYLNAPNLIMRAQLPQTSTWEKLEKNINNMELIDGLKTEHGREFAKDYINTFREMKKIARSHHRYRIKEQARWLNQRSNLYQHIYDYDSKLRELLHLDIDRCYNETISESSANGRLVFSDRSDSLLPFPVREKHMNLVDTSNIASGVSENNIIVPEEIESQSSMIEKIIYVLNKKEVQKQIERIREIRITKGLPKGFIKKEELKHLDFLTQHFSNVIIKQSGKGRIVEYSYKGLSFGIRVYVSHRLGEYLGDIPLVASLVGELASTTLEKAGVKIGPLKEKIGSFFIQKDKEVMIGRVRDWLTAPPPQK